MNADDCFHIQIYEKELVINATAIIKVQDKKE